MSLTGVCDECIYVYTVSLRRFGYELQLCVCVFVDVQKTRVKEKFEGSPLHLFSASLWWDHIIHRGLSGNFISL